MFHNKKKGFTIVELVIVIAVIAVLAAVLIPTFANLVEEANKSADQQAVTNMNKLLATEEKSDNIDGVIEILIKNNYAGDLTTYYRDYSLAWVSAENVIVLVKDNAIVYPEAYVGKELVFELIKPMAKDADSLTNGLVDGNVVYVSENVTVGDFSPENVGNYTVNLNNNKLVSSGYVGSWVEGADIAISNGTIDATASNNSTVVLAENGAKVELSNVQIYANSGKNPIQCYGGKMTLNNVTTSQSGEAETAWYNSAIQIVNPVKQIDGVWTITGASELTVNSGMYSGKRAIQMSAPGGTLIVNGGTFVGTEYVIVADYNANYAAQGAVHSVTINGGSFTGAVKIGAGVTCVINGGTFSVNIGEVANVTIGEGKTVADNGNGTWTVK